MGMGQNSSPNCGTTDFSICLVASKKNGVPNDNDLTFTIIPTYSLWLWFSGNIMESWDIWIYNQQISTMSGPTVTFHGFPSSHPRQNPWPGCHPIAPVEAQEQRDLTHLTGPRKIWGNLPKITAQMEG